ncbi:hypothetical protein [Phytohabitans houttuyneae]|nr:hypothetical protein [Phytohabitans houttuyneae]
MCLVAPLAACFGDPEASPVGFVNTGGQAAAVIPACADEDVLSLAVDDDPYDEAGSLKPESDTLWKVSDPRQPRSTGPFVIGDTSPWRTESTALNGELPNSYMLSIETTRRLATSHFDKTRVASLGDREVLIDGEVGSLKDLAKRWGC